MSKKPSQLKGRAVNLPLFGDASHNVGFFIAIGQLVIAWANNESLFQAMLNLLLGSTKTTSAVVWYSHRTTNARLELVLRLGRDRLKNSTLLAEIEKATNDFKGFTRVRNFFCHAIYNYSSDLKLDSVSGYTLSQEGDPVRIETKPMDARTVNEITSTTKSLMDFNLATWDLVSRLAVELGAPPIKRPSLPAETL